MTKLTVIVPAGAGEEGVEEFLLALGGGFSAYEGRGVWKDSKGVVEEFHTRYECAFERAVGHPAIKAAILAAMPGEECVYVEVGGEVILWER